MRGGGAMRRTRSVEDERRPDAPASSTRSIEHGRPIVLAPINDYRAPWRHLLPEHAPPVVRPVPWPATDEERSASAGSRRASRSNTARELPRWRRAPRRP